MPRDLCTALMGVWWGPTSHALSTSTKLADVAWTAQIGRKDHVSDVRVVHLIGMAVRIVCELCVL